MFPSKNMVQMAFGSPQNQHRRSQIPPDLFRQGVLEHATSLGMDPAVDGAFLWIAEKSLQEKLPMNWIQLNTNDGDVYFYNQLTGESSWEHPKDAYYRNLFREKKAQKVSGFGSPKFVVDRSSFSNEMNIYNRGNFVDPNLGGSHLRKRNISSNREIISQSTYTTPMNYTTHRPQTTPSSSNITNNDMQHSPWRRQQVEEVQEWQNVFSPNQNLNQISNQRTSYREASNHTPSRLENRQEESPNTRNMTSNSNINFSYEALKDGMQRLSLSDDDEEEVENYKRNMNQTTITIKRQSEETSKQLNLALSDVREKNEQIKLLEEKLEKLTKTENDFLKVKDETETLRKENESIKQSIHEKENSFQKDIERMEMQQSSCIETKKDLELRISTKERKIKEMKENHENELESLKQKLSSMQTNSFSLENEIQSKLSSINKLEREISFKEDDICTQKQKYEVLMKKLNLLESESESNRNDVQQYKDLLEELTSSKKQLICQIDSLHTQISDAQESARKSANEINSLKECLESNRRTAASIKSESESMRLEMQKWKNKYTEEREKAKVMSKKVIELQGNIRVFCRIRPLSSKEQRELIADGTEVTDIHKSVQYLDDDRVLFYGVQYDYDRVFAPNAIQGSVFSEIAPAVSSSMDGHNVCIFAYGQTGSGKTYTMEGKTDDRGVNYRALAELFEMASKAKAEMEYTFLVSVLEVYNESIHDLLVKSNSNQQAQGLALHMRKEHVYVEGLVEEKVKRCDEIEEIMALASSNRRTANNNINEHSSRSHLVLSVKIRGREIKTGTRTSGKLNLIDLAGSERLKHTSACGQRLKEAQNINRSLSALGDVVAALGCGSKHVPYRNSKLTFLLQDSLCANSKVLMFVNINPSPKSVGESVCSLKFASRCRAVQLGKSKRESHVSIARNLGSSMRRPILERHESTASM